MIFGIIGFINSGKGTIASLLVNKFNFRQDSFAASLKDVCASIFGWPRHLLEGDTPESREWREIPDLWWSEKLNIPNFSPRFALQYMGTDILRNHFHEDLWFLTVLNRIKNNSEQHVVISDVRFPNEIKFIKEQNGILIQVNRGSIPVWYETALLANKGNTLAREIMKNTYSSAHMSEWAWVGSNVDYEINNVGTLEELERQISIIIHEIL